MVDRRASVSIIDDDIRSFGAVEYHTHDVRIVNIPPFNNVVQYGPVPQMLERNVINKEPSDSAIRCVLPPDLGIEDALLFDEFWRVISDQGDKLRGFNVPAIFAEFVFPVFGSRKVSCTFAIRVFIDISKDGKRGVRYSLWRIWETGLVHLTPHPKSVTRLPLVSLEDDRVALTIVGLDSMKTVQLVTEDRGVISFDYVKGVFVDRAIDHC
jgi:hypothetical protein